MSREAVRRRVAELVRDATGGAVAPEQALVADASLVSLGVGSLNLLRLVDAVEEEFGVEVDLGDGVPETIDQFVDRFRPRVADRAGS